MCIRDSCSTAPVSVPKTSSNIKGCCFTKFKRFSNLALALLFNPLKSSHISKFSLTTHSKGDLLMNGDLHVLSTMKVLAALDLICYQMKNIFSKLAL